MLDSVIHLLSYSIFYNLLPNHNILSIDFKSIFVQIHRFLSSYFCFGKSFSVSSLEKCSLISWKCGNVTDKSHNLTSNKSSDSNFFGNRTICKLFRGIILQRLKSISKFELSKLWIFVEMPSKSQGSIYWPLFSTTLSDGHYTIWSIMSPITSSEPTCHQSVWAEINSSDELHTRPPSRRISEH